jgi:hypothetical protein
MTPARRRLIGLVLMTAASYPLGLALGYRFLLPVLNTAPAYVLLVRLVREGRRAEAVGAMLLWAATLALVGTTTFALWPSDPGHAVVHGAQYRDEMFHWIRTGEGSEGSPRLFLPQHLLHLAAFVALCLASASAAGITLGSVLMNYMGYYVASLHRAGAPAGAVVLLGWQPWALCRVAAFCVLGVVLAEPLLARLKPYPYPGLHVARAFLVAAAAGILADWVLKAVLAPSWGLWLRALLPATA